MKKLNILLILALMLPYSIAYSQTATKTSDKSNLPIGVWIPEQTEALPASAGRNLENKLQQILQNNGLGTGINNARFILVPSIHVESKDITPTAPAMFAYNLLVTLFIGDGIEGKSFASYSTTVKGVGENETKAYLAAIGNIRTNDKAYQDFIDKAKNRIIDYYNSHCDIIIREAKMLATLRQYDEAIWQLTSVPEVCTTCRDKALNAVAPIFQQKVDYECKLKLSEATAIWNAGQNSAAADEAGRILITIDPNASCFKDAKALSDRIAKKIYETDKREWEYIYDKNIGLQRDMIKAYRDVGVAYGNGQPKNVTYKSFW